MNLEDRIATLVKLGQYIRSNNEELANVQTRAQIHNKWFTPENINFALNAWGNDLLIKEVLEKWVEQYIFNDSSQKKVGLVLAGNIPLVGFHDIVSTFISGHQSLIKASSKDTVLTRHLVNKLIEFTGESDLFEITDSLKGMDAVIATGSNYSAGQFEKYFGKYPNIIRRNRNAVAILEGNENEEDFKKMGIDVFSYFGLGCRNVAKLYVPKSYNFTALLEVLHENYKELINHSKYKNNYDYNYALYLLNKEDFLATGAIILRKNKDITSRIACLHYEEYDDINRLEKHLKQKANEIQCVSTKMSISGTVTIPLGKCQKPEIYDYADGVDTLSFLTNLN